MQFKKMAQMTLNLCAALCVSVFEQPTDTKTTIIVQMTQSVKKVINVANVDHIRCRQM